MSAANVPLMGFEGRAYTGDSEIKNIRSLKFGVSFTEVDSTVQGNHGVESYSKGLKDVVLGFDKVVTDNPDAQDTAVMNAILNRTPIPLTFIEKESGSGPSGTFHIFGGEQTLDGDGLQVIPCTAKPATGYDPPTIADGPTVQNNTPTGE